MPKITPGLWLMRNGNAVWVFANPMAENKLIGKHGDIHLEWDCFGLSLDNDPENDILKRAWETVGDPRPRAHAGGVKHDDGKLPLHLLPFDALEAIAEILDFGAKKYAPRNWEKGMDWHRLFRATTGHMWSWFLRRGNDPETGKSHLWHAGCCILFLIAYELRGIGNDTRPSEG